MIVCVLSHGHLINYLIEMEDGELDKMDYHFPGLCRTQRGITLYGEPGTEFPHCLKP